MKNQPERSSISQDNRKKPTIRLGVNEKFTIDSMKTSFVQSSKNTGKTFNGIENSYQMQNVLFFVLFRLYNSRNNLLR